MSRGSRSKRRRREKMGNRMAMFGLTLVVGSLAVVVGIRSCSLREKDAQYQIQEQRLEAQLEEEQRRGQALEEERVYVQTKQYIEKIAKEKLGLVNPDEILLKPSN